MKRSEWEAAQKRWNDHNVPEVVSVVRAGEALYFAAADRVETLEDLLRDMAEDWRHNAYTRVMARETLK